MGYTFKFLNPTDPFYPGWVELRRRRTLRNRCLVGAIAAILLLAFVAEYAGFPPFVFMAAALAILIAFARVHWWVMRWPCPRCGRAFYLSLWGYRPFADCCLHCDLPEYAADEHTTDATATH